MYKIRIRENKIKKLGGIREMGKWGDGEKDIQLYRSLHRAEQYLGVAQVSYTSPKVKVRDINRFQLEL